MYQINHDYHIHTHLSTCSNHPEQTVENLIKYAERNGFSELCITDHFWDSNVSGASDWYQPQDYAHIAKNLPLPQNGCVKCYFGCETELDKHMTLGISEKMMDKFDFIIIPTTHLHMDGFTVERGKTSVKERAEIYVERLDKLLDKDLPFEKVGIAHLTSRLVSYNRATDFEEHLCIFEAVGESTYRELFSKLAKRGAGVEINYVKEKYTEEQLDRLFRPYEIAKEEGCKFYFGSDAHVPQTLDLVYSRFEYAVNKLKLQEKDRFRFHK